MEDHAAAASEPSPSSGAPRYGGASAQAIQHHYDVGNAFYALWLDPTLTYSCALWDDGSESLERAQLRKLDFHIAQAGVKPGDRVLEVGCGWGSLARRLVETHGASSVRALTLSQAQRDWIEALGDRRIEVTLENWFDHEPDAPYDALVSIAAFEAFARSGVPEPVRIASYRAFFERCHRWLKPGARMSLQAIARGNMRATDASTFIADEVFPESQLPNLAEIAAASERLFEITRLRDDRYHYARTLKEWRRALKAARSSAVQLVGEAVVARYERYLEFALIGFHVGTTGLLRIGLKRIDRPRT